MPKPLLITYNLEGQRQSRIRLMASRYGIRFRFIRPEAQHIPIKELLEEALPAFDPMAGQPFTDELMVMAYFPSHLASKFLDAFRQQGLPSVKLKALLTETNSQWSGLQLHEELSQEADYFARMKKSLHDRAEEAESAEE